MARTHKAGAENVCVGIGVSTAAQGKAVGQYADGVIVGSALVHTLLTEDGDARELTSGLAALAAKTAELAEESTTPACSGTLLVGGRDNESGCQPIPVLCRYRFSTLYSSI